MGTAVVGTAWGPASAGLDTAAPCGGALPASFSSDWAIEASGAEKLGNWTSAIRRAAIQKMWLWVKSASRASTPTSCI